MSEVTFTKDELGYLYHLIMEDYDRFETVDETNYSFMSVPLTADFSSRLCDKIRNLEEV